MNKYERAAIIAGAVFFGLLALDSLFDPAPWSWGKPVGAPTYSAFAEFWKGVGE